MKLFNKRFSVLWIIGAICLIGIMYMAVSGSFSTASGSVEDIASKIVRFHVIANSDSDEDQAVKLKVKEAVVKYVQNETKDFKDVEETKDFLLHNTDAILKISKDTLRENGFDYTVTAQLTNCYFPVKSYGDAVFPAGEYEAYRIKIGEAKGKNWWCVLYPPLCFVDASTGILPDASKKDLEDVLGAGSYHTVCPDNNSDVKFRFKFLKFLNGLFD